MNRETDQLISKDQVSNLTGLNVLCVAVLNERMLRICHHPICVLLVFEVQPYGVCVCVCVQEQRSPGVPSWLLANSGVFPSHPQPKVHTHFCLYRACQQ